MPGLVYVAWCVCHTHCHSGVVSLSADQHQVPVHAGVSHLAFQGLEEVPESGWQGAEQGAWRDSEKHLHLWRDDGSERDDGCDGLVGL